MRGVLLTTAAVLFTSAMSAAAGAQNAPHRGDPQAGRRLALHACDACHIVAANQDIRPLVPGYAPSFFDVANKPGVTAQTLEAFLAERHPTGAMPFPQLTAAQIDDLASYILTLRTPR
jgi:mono/diheme cytochrome c family protein